MSLATREWGSLVAFGSARLVRVSAVTTAALVVLASLGTLVVAYEAADRVVHPPRELRSVTPAARGLAFERVAFETADEVPLVGWWMPAESAQGTVVFLHGYRASKAQALSVAPFLVRNHFNVLAFDFRAHGESGGSYTTVGLVEALDVRAALDHLATRPDVDPTRIALFGWSMGAAAALHAAPTSPEVRAIVADSSFARLTNAVSNELASMSRLPSMPFVPLILLFASGMTDRSTGDNVPAREAEKLHRPLLVIQGERDALARAEADGATIARAAGDWGSLWLVPGAGHVDARRAQPLEYESRVVTFLREALT